MCEEGWIGVASTLLGEKDFFSVNKASGIIQYEYIDIFHSRLSQFLPYQIWKSYAINACID